MIREFERWVDHRLVSARLLGFWPMGVFWVLARLV